MIPHYEYTPLENLPTKRSIFQIELPKNVKSLWNPKKINFTHGNYTGHMCFKLGLHFEIYMTVAGFCCGAVVLLAFEERHRASTSLDWSSETKPRISTSSTMELRQNTSTHLSWYVLLSFQSRSIVLFSFITVCRLNSSNLSSSSRRISILSMVVTMAHGSRDEISAGWSYSSSKADILSPKYTYFDFLFVHQINIVSSQPF